MTAIDSMVFRHIFSSEQMRQVFSDENRVQCYLDIEAALKASATLTTRWLMEGDIYIPEHVLGKRKQAVDTPANAFTGR